MKKKLDKEIVAFICFAVLAIAYRLLLPFGDEPDFYVRLGELQAGVYPFPYNLFDWFYSLFKLDLLDAVRASPISLSQQAERLTDFEFLRDVIFRGGWLFVFTSPLLIIFFRKNNELERDSVLLTVVFPAFIYYTSILSHEALFSALTILCITFFHRWLIVLILLSFFFFLDPGNFLVFLAFLIIRFFFYRLTVARCLIAMFGLGLFGLIVKSSLLDYVVGSGLPGITPIAQAMIQNLDGGEFYEKYPVVLRPVITFMSSVFMTPAYLKSVPAYVLAVYGFIILVGRIRRAKIPDSSYIKEIIAYFSVILIFVFMFPNYGNFKYYVFGIFLISRISIVYFGFEKVFFFYFAINSLIIMSLFFAWF